MKTVNLATGENIKLTLFPDNQPHVTLSGVEAGDSVRVVAPLRNANNVLHLLQISEVIRGLDAYCYELFIPYLLAARYDRRFHKGESFDLAIIAELINRCNFRHVKILDPHSEAATDWIMNSEAVQSRELYSAYDLPDAVVIFPDKGAALRLGNRFVGTLNPNFTAEAFVSKTRDGEGRVVDTHFLPDAKSLEGRNCLILDDLCDGGATFLSIAHEIEHQGIKPLTLSLMVTHGIFSKGLGELSRAFDRIFTTNSYPQYSGYQAALKVIDVL